MRCDVTACLTERGGTSGAGVLDEASEARDSSIVSLMMKCSRKLFNGISAGRAMLGSEFLFKNSTQQATHDEEPEANTNGKDALQPPRSLVCELFVYSSLMVARVPPLMPLAHSLLWCNLFTQCLFFCVASLSHIWQSAQNTAVFSTAALSVGGSVSIGSSEVCESEAGALKALPSTSIRAREVLPGCSVAFRVTCSLIRLAPQQAKSFSGGQCSCCEGSVPLHNSH